MDLQASVGSRSVPEGLRFHASQAGESYGVQTWKDRAKERIEDQVKAILIGLLDKVVSIKARREERRLAELERRRLEQLRWQQQERRTANAALLVATGYRGRGEGLS